MESLKQKYKNLVKQRNQVIEKIKTLKIENSEQFLIRKQKVQTSKSSKSFFAKPERPPSIQQTVSEHTRNRNMFSQLLGHLGKAKKELIQDRQRLQIQQDTQQRVEKEQKKQAQTLMAQHRAQLDVRAKQELKQEYHIEKVRLDKEIQQADAQIKVRVNQTLKYKKRVQNYQGFIKTLQDLLSTQPQVFYRPAKMNQETRQKRIQTSAEIEVGVMQEKARIWIAQLEESEKVEDLELS